MTRLVVTGVREGGAGHSGIERWPLVPAACWRRRAAAGVVVVVLLVVSGRAVSAMRACGRVRGARHGPCRAWAVALEERERE